jgi:deoxyribodipyrimidine photo-lyase
VLPIFIFDQHILHQLEDKKDARVEFILHQILALKNALEDHGSTLNIYFDTPEKAFKQMHDTYRIKKVYANRDYEPYTISRDQKITNLLKEQDISFQLFKDHLIFEGKDILKQDGTPFKVFTPYKKVWLEKYEEIKENKVEKFLHFDKFLKANPAKEPTLKSLGFIHSSIVIPPKEAKLKTILEYDKKRDFPALNGTSRLGIHFRFGTISIREKVQKAKKYNQTFLNELIWREFYAAILQHFPHVTTEAFNKKYNLIPWKNNEGEFIKWCNGYTGYPIVDAGMRELNKTGYMHNRVRMITASFLTKHLLIDWRWGEAYFAKKLLDFELASNNGGWQWAAGTGTDAQPYFRVFNPESQAQKFDPKSEYIKKWVPEFGTKEYPKPIVDHKSARLRAIETYKSVVSK